MNNLPVGLELGKYVGSAHPPAGLNAAALMGVNVGPNFSANGSLATVLWLAVLRRGERRRLAAEVRRGRPGDDAAGPDRRRAAGPLSEHGAVPYHTFAA